MARSRRTVDSQPSRLTSVTSAWNELLPRSSTATRTPADGTGGLRRGGGCASGRAEMPRAHDGVAVALQRPDRGLLGRHPVTPDHSGVRETVEDAQDHVA